MAGLKKHKLLNGNYETSNPTVDVNNGNDVTRDFETEVIKKLGGSIAMVRDSPLVEEN